MRLSAAQPQSAISSSWVNFPQTNHDKVSLCLQKTLVLFSGWQQNGSECKYPVILISAALRTHYVERHLSQFACWCNCIVTLHEIDTRDVTSLPKALIPHHYKSTAIRWIDICRQFWLNFGLNTHYSHAALTGSRLPCVARPNASAEQPLDAKPIDQKQDVIFPPTRQSSDAWELRKPRKSPQSCSDCIWAITNRNTPW